ncbi:CRISPR-associated endonuclease Cas2 [Desulfurobacterium atlanticum]|uniref:CRISPR-associated endoribonuclease Cas2 n=1 Tax=Desulfurobacterium atlanticum TaxID=240169 RepID=A0A239A223_9BACT|nr:CRISPR-associated endonuclease Cas2 [Desulfurobacterium atlanticum]SNR89705.1 CRISPR-associated protein Cas2 [Desulfurobacterium atlanticum]
MFVILVYDAGEKRVQKFLKICRKYLVHVQNSVFEGEITEAVLKMLINELKTVINEDEDSVLVYKFRTKKYYERLSLGIDKPSHEKFVF